MTIKLIWNDSSLYTGDADLLFTNPYAPVPAQLHGKPSIINQYMGANDGRKETCERWLGGAKLLEISKWGQGLRNTMFVANLPVKEIDLTDLVEDMTDSRNGAGWFPLPLVARMLMAYKMPGKWCWDGFAGRGTVGKGCRLVGMHFIGIERDAVNFEIMRNYLDPRHINPNAGDPDHGKSYH